MEFQEFTDYTGPSGLHVATGSEIVPLNSAEGMAAVAESAMLASLGSSSLATQYAAKMAQSLDAAHEADLASAS
jgi:hypothetical protein